jgi:hypothetical protein
LEISAFNSNDRLRRLSLGPAKSFFRDSQNENTKDSKLIPNLNPKLTFRQLALKQEQNSLAGIRNIAVNSATGFSLITILTALASRLIGNQSLAKASLNLAKKATQLTFMTYGGFAALKAYGDNDVGVGASQALEVAIPALTTDACDMTMNRGFSIGMGTFINEAKKYISRSKYQSFSESANDLMQSTKQFFRDLKNNPLQSISNFDGPGSMLMGLVTASAPILKHVFGLDKIASMVRHFPGMAMELGKVNKGVLNRGANLYFSSGVLMLGSSFINLFSGFSKNKDRKQTIELGTWLLNVIGRKLLVESIRNNELASDKQKTSIGPIEALKKSLDSIFTWGTVT